MLELIFPGEAAWIFPLLGSVSFDLVTSSKVYKKIPIDLNEAFVDADLGLNLEKYFSRWLNKLPYQQNLSTCSKKVLEHESRLKKGNLFRNAYLPTHQKKILNHFKEGLTF